MNEKLISPLERLTAAQRELVKNRLLQKNLSSGREQLRIRPIPREGDLPLSFAQWRLWFLDQLDPHQATYNLPAAWRLTGNLNIPILEAGLTEIVSRHETLRTTFREANGEPAQWIGPPRQVPLPILDLSGLPVALGQSESAQLIAREAGLPFDLAEGPLMRAKVVRLNQREHLLLCTLHQTVADAWSLGLLARELVTLYSSLASGLPPPLTPLQIQYADYAVWQRQWLAGERLEAGLAYWREKLAGLGLLELPTDRQRLPVPSFHSAQLPFRSDANLKELSGREGVTPFMAFLASVQVLISRWTGQDEIPVGVLVAGRSMADLESLIGRFLNTLTLRGDLSGEPSFREILKRTRASTLGIFEHQYIPFELLVEEVKPERDLSRAPLFQVLVSYRNKPGWSPVFADLSLEQIPTSDRKSPFDLEFFLEEADEGWTGAVEYRCDLFDAPTVQRLALRLELLLTEVAANPEQRVSELRILPESEQAQLLWEWNDTAVALSHLCLHDLFAVQAARTPEATALIWDTQRITYRELDSRSNRLARLLRDLGVGPEVRVGVCLERSPELVVSLLAVLKAGGAYVPLDSAYPPDRLQFLLEDSRAALLVSSQSLVRIWPHYGIRHFLLEEQQEMISAFSDAPLEPQCREDNLAYIIYTSGSTGRPKGVAVEHRSVTMLVRWASEEFSSEELSGVLAATSISFDLSVFELYVPLALGGMVVLAENVLELPNLPAASEVTLVDTVPAAIAELLRRGLPSGVRTVNLGGERLSREIAFSIYNLTAVQRVLNLYGPSEDTTYSTMEQVEEDGEKSPSIGRPLTGKSAYVVDQSLRLMPLGANGELVLAGMGLARGYLDRPDLTAERFRPNPFGREPGARLYRTGDLARQRTDGRLEFLGRLDHQVKVRGFRVEPAEIEVALLSHPAVRDAVIALQGNGSDRRLVAYVILGESAITPLELRQHLRERLPGYMVPAALIVLDALPLTASGKVDRRALPDPGSIIEAAEGYIPPRTPAEEILAGIWEEVLGINRVSMQNNFFDLGGHSLLVQRVVSRVRDALQVEIPVISFFEHPTIRSLAAAIEAASIRRFEEGGDVVAARRVDLPAITLGSFAQERFWVLAKLGADDDISYNVPVSLRFEGELEITILESALRDIMRRHEVLRATFYLWNDQLVQQVSPESHPSISVIDLQALRQVGANAISHEVLRLWDREARRLFDLSLGPLMRVSALRLSEREHQLLVTFHHIVIDAWSIDIFVRELEATYRRLSQGLGPSIPDLKFHYSDFAERQRKLLTMRGLDRQLKYWKESLAGAPEMLTFPTDRPRPKILSSKGGRIVQSVGEKTVADLRRLARHQNATLFMVLLAAFEVLLRRWTDQGDLVFGTPVSNRRWQESENVIGLFLNTVVLRDKILGNPRFEELSAQVRETFFGGLENQDFPFERIVEELRPSRSLSHSPLFQLLVVHRKSASRGAGGLIKDVQIGSVGSKFDMTFSFLETENDVVTEIEFNRDLFDDSTVRRILGHFFCILDGILEEPWRPILDYHLLRQPERHLLLTEWNDTQGEFHAALLPQRFASQALLTPDALAVVCGRESLTYGELDARSGRLARQLEARGVGPEVPVALLLDRTPGLLTAVLAVLRAGGAYVPLDPEAPTERLAKIFNDLEGISRGAFVLAEDRFVDRLPMPLQVDTRRRISFNWECAVLEQCQGRGFTRPIEPQSLAYILYTSGTSGVPKGVAVEHRSVAAFLDWAEVSFDPEERRVVLAVTPLTFDLSVFELFLPLTTGGCVMMRDELTLLELGLGSTEVSLVNTVPSLITSLLETGTLPASAAAVNLAGETLRRSVVTEVFKSGTVRRLLNLYGPTESTVYATVATISPEEIGEPSLGRPIRNIQVYVVNEMLELQPIGAPGELVLGGEGIARGYWNHPGLTAERFIPNPFGGIAARLYRTGDLVRWLPDGKLELLGRLDRQVKIRGLRIEPGDVEASLHQHPGVREAVVMAKGTSEGEPQLVAYVRPKDADGGLRASELRAFLQPRVPRGLVPSAIVFVKEIPRTDRGKVDFMKLPEPDWTGEETAEFIPPRSPAEKRLAGIWSEVLGGVRHLSASDNFFDRGGHSLRAAQVVARLRQAGVELPLRRIFEKPQLGELAREIEKWLSARGLRELAASGEKDAVPWTAVKNEARRESLIVGEEPLTYSEGVEVADLLRVFLEEKARALKRRPVLSFPARCRLNTTEILHFQLVAMVPVDHLLQRLARLRILQTSCTETLFVKVTAPSFQVSPHLARVQVPADGDSDLVSFTMDPLEPGMHVVEIELFAGADRVGYFTLETEVVPYVH